MQSCQHTLIVSYFHGPCKCLKSWKNNKAVFQKYFVYVLLFSSDEELLDIPYSLTLTFDFRAIDLIGATFLKVFLIKCSASNLVSSKGTKYLPWEGGPLTLQILSESLLNLSQEISKTLQRPLHSLDVQHIHHHGRLAHLLHQGQELSTATI